MAFWFWGAVAVVKRVIVDSDATAAFFTRIPEFQLAKAEIRSAFVTQNVLQLGRAGTIRVKHVSEKRRLKKNPPAWPDCHSGYTKTRQSMEAHPPMERG